MIYIDYKLQCNASVIFVVILDIQIPSNKF